MRDTRKMRGIAVVAITAAIGAVLGEHFVKPGLERKLGVRRR